MVVLLVQHREEKLGEMDDYEQREREKAKASLFETWEAKGRCVYRGFAYTVFVGIFLIWVYRILYIPIISSVSRLWVWFGMLLAEVWFGFYWICTQSPRWNVTYQQPFKRRISQRYEDESLPGVDIFVCTADPVMEPPKLVINTILSLMSYNYPPHKLAVYLSDDGGSELTFYAILEASKFAKRWIPFCKTHNIEPRSPEAYFAQNSDVQKISYAQDWLLVKNLYQEMKQRLESTIERGKIGKEIRDQHKGFSEWDNNVTKTDHHSIVQIVIDGRDETELDNNGCRLPTLVYLAREKRPQFPHQFKAGAMNALIRVSSEISNGPIILNLDCDMYANDPDGILDALCFFMDEQRGHQIAFVQHPQCFENITKNDIYANMYSVVNKLELPGIGGYGSALYCGTGCFHRRESLSGKKHSQDNKLKLNNFDSKRNDKRTINELEEASKAVANCSYEKDTLWGQEMGLVYGCPVEDIVTGLTIQCRGWKSIYYCPDKEAFLGIAPNTLEISLIQHKRWCEGLFQIFLTKYCPFIYGHGKIKLGAQLGYCCYLLWAPLSLAVLYYVIVPPLCLLHGFPLFPQVSSLWIIPFAYVFISTNIYSVVESLACGSSIKAWWNLQTMWVIRRTTSYFFAFIDTISKQLGLSQTSFAITPKVVTEDVLKRYEKEVMEFGSSSIMFTMIATFAMLNLFCLVGVISKKFVNYDLNFEILEKFGPQIVLCGLMVVVNLPVYSALFLRHDKGRLPPLVMFKSIVLASLACLMLVPLK